MSVIVTLCPECDEVVDEPGPPRYECGACGEFLGDDGNRCPMCNKFATKVSDATCPNCEVDLDVDELDEVERWHAADGTMHATAADAAAWDAAAPERAERAAAYAEVEAQRRIEHARQRTDRVDRLIAALDTSPVQFEYYEPEHRHIVIESHSAMVTPVEWLTLLGAPYELAPPRYDGDRVRVARVDWDAARATLAAAGVDWRGAISAPDQFDAWASSMLDSVRFGVEVEAELLPLIAKVAADA